MIQVAAGNPLPLTQAEVPLIGHAFEARIYAENPRNNFLPDVGPLIHMSTPDPSSGIRLEQGIEQGSNVEVYYDPMISKIVAHGRDRTEALRVLRKALEEYQVVGVSTNVEFLHALASHRAFIDGEVETGFIAVLVFGFLFGYLLWRNFFPLLRNTTNHYSPIFLIPLLRYWLWQRYSLLSEKRNLRLLSIHLGQR